MGEQFPNTYNVPQNPWGSAPGHVDNEWKTLDTLGSPASIPGIGQVLVSSVAGVYNTVTVAWPAIPTAVSYSVYAGFSPFFTQAVLKTTTASLTYTFQFYPSVPTDSIIQVWVQATLPDTSTVLIQSDPANVENLNDYFARTNNPLETGYSDVTIDNDYMRFVVAESRRRAMSMILNDGEDFVLYPRRWVGTYCNCNEQYGSEVPGQDAIQGDLNSADSGIGKPPDVSGDPQGDALHRCTRCFGTQIKGGYYSGSTLKMRYGNLPSRMIFYRGTGLELPHNFNSWALWNPRLHAQDIVRRVKTSEMFVVNEPKRSELRGIPLHQELNLDLLPPGDIRALVTDTSIASGEAA